MLKLMTSAGTNLYPSGVLVSSVNLAILWAYPIAIIAAYGLKIVGTKYLPPMLPTLDTLNVPSAKSSASSELASVFILTI